ncbi:MAG TPA: hypothetical protein VGQ97_05855 [Xanthobacteraceae bacterium]|nr:hypothetical protein [Xanthobacteraceae bacterium]
MSQTASAIRIVRYRLASAWTQAIVVGALALSILVLVIGVGAATA